MMKSPFSSSDHYYHNGIPVAHLENNDKIPGAHDLGHWGETAADNENRAVESLQYQPITANWTNLEPKECTADKILGNDGRNNNDMSFAASPSRSDVQSYHADSTLLDTLSEVGSGWATPDSGLSFHHELTAPLASSTPVSCVSPSKLQMSLVSPFDFTASVFTSDHLGAPISSPIQNLSFLDTPRLMSYAPDSGGASLLGQPLPQIRVEAFSPPRQPSHATFPSSSSQYLGMPDSAQERGVVPLANLTAPSHFPTDAPNISDLPRRGRRVGSRQRLPSNDSHSNDSSSQLARISFALGTKRPHADSTSDRDALSSVLSVDSSSTGSRLPSKRRRTRRSTLVLNAKAPSGDMTIDSDETGGVFEESDLDDDSDVYEPSSDDPSVRSPSPAEPDEEQPTTTSIQRTPKRKRHQGRRVTATSKAKGSAAAALRLFDELGTSFDERASESVDEGGGSEISFSRGYQRKRKNGKIPQPIPVPDLIKKSRGRKVPHLPVEENDQFGDLEGDEDTDSRKPRKKKRGTRVSPNEGDRTYVCVVEGCGKCFVRGEHLKRHVRSIHTNEKPHVCPYPGCAKFFSRRDNLGQHVRMHLQP